MAYTDVSAKTILQAWGEFRGKAYVALKVGDLIGRDTSNGGWILANKTSGAAVAAEAVALDTIAAGSVGWMALATVIKAPPTEGAGGVMTEGVLALATDLCSPLYLSTSGTASTTAGVAPDTVQGVGFVLATDQALLKGVSRLSQLGIDSDLDLAGYKLLFANTLLREYTSNIVIIRNRADSIRRDLALNSLYLSESVFFQSDGGAIQSPNVDDNYTLLMARRNGAGMYEVARLAGGAEEAFEFLKGKLTGELKGNGKAISNVLIADEVTSAPAADATQVGRIIRVRSGAGVATSVKMCCLNSANAYEWVVLGTAS